MKHPRTLTLAHWGAYEVEYDETGKAIQLHPFAKDPDPSPIGLHMLSDEVERLRVRRPAVRKSWLEHGPGAFPERRGAEPFVEIPWDEALDLVAGELARVKREFGNRAIFGGSYGWSSAGRFHHAQSQIRRFLNSIGGFVRHKDDYSVGAALVLMPHIVGPLEELLASHTSWDALARHCELFVSFGGVPRKNGQINAGGAAVHRTRSGLFGLREAGVRFVNVTPTADDLDTGGNVEWLAIRPNTDAAMILALCHTLLIEGLHDQAFLDRYTIGFEKFRRYLSGEQDGQPKDAAWAVRITGIAADRTFALARAMAARRTMISIVRSVTSFASSAASFARSAASRACRVRRRVAAAARSRSWLRAISAGIRSVPFMPLPPSEFCCRGGYTGAKPFCRKLVLVRRLIPLPRIIVPDLSLRDALGPVCWAQTIIPGPEELTGPRPPSW